MRRQGDLPVVQLVQGQQRWNNKKRAEHR
jgi:hypothetical protein